MVNAPSICTCSSCQHDDFTNILLLIIIIVIILIFTLLMLLLYRVEVEDE